MAKKTGAGGIIVVALVLGLITAWLIWSYLDSVDKKSRKNWDTIVVARVDIKPRTQITRDMIALEQFPKNLIAETSIRDVKDVENRTTQNMIKAKDQVRTSDLLQEGQAPTLAFKIPDGMRAIAIGASEIMAVGTSVQPGDHVDILATYMDPRVKQEMTKMLLQNVLVLAVNKGNTDSGGKEGGASSSMTLAVRPEETELIAAADRAGALRVSLRSIKDTKIVASGGVTARDLGGMVPEEPAPVQQQPVQAGTPEPKKVPVFINVQPSSKTRTEIEIVRGVTGQTVTP
jgi:pilus assembly protein CpaB